MATANSFQLGILPERKISLSTLVSSYSFVIFMVVVVINIGLIWPERLQIARNYHVTELIPLPNIEQPEPIKPKAPPVVQHVKLLPAAPLPVFETPKLTVPKEIRVVHKQPEEVVAPKIKLNEFATVLKPLPGGARQAKLVHTGEFGSSATPTVNAPIQKVQTGGFGDPNGVKGTGKADAHLQIASTGAFDLPSGPGQGNGTGGAKGIKGTVASAGFGSGIAQPGQGDGRSNGKGVQSSGFGSQEVAQVAKQHLAVEGPPTTPVEITFKPNPVYTQDARQLKIEGDVLLEVSFGVNGQLHVNHVVRGLGHGLDEAAVAAADLIRFKPALRNGTPVDSTAIVHVIFRLAY